MTSQNDNAKRWRPWQFSLRTLLVTMLVVASFFAGWNARDWYLRREKPFQWMDEMGTVITVDRDGNMLSVQPSRGSTANPNGF